MTEQPPERIPPTKFFSTHYASNAQPPEVPQREGLVFAANTLQALIPEEGLMDEYTQALARKAAVKVRSALPQREEAPKLPAEVSELFDLEQKHPPLVGNRHSRAAAPAGTSQGLEARCATFLEQYYLYRQNPNVPGITGADLAAFILTRDAERERARNLELYHLLFPEGTRKEFDTNDIPAMLDAYTEECEEYQKRLHAPLREEKEKFERHWEATKKLAIKQAEEFRARERALREALKKYGHHTNRCKGFPATSEEQLARDCDCGFTALAQQREGQP